MIFYNALEIKYYVKILLNLPQPLLLYCSRKDVGALKILFAGGKSMFHF